jgi:hypothetical protein
MTKKDILYTNSVQQLSSMTQNINPICFYFRKILRLTARVHIYLLTDLLTYSVEQSQSWEANRLSASQKILRIL